MITFITAGRNDDYGDRFLERFYISTSKNLEIVEKFNINYEYLIVEWNPIKKYLINEESYFKNLFQKHNSLIDIIVKPSVVLNENLSPFVFYEYFAKNVGIRISNYEILIILNSDIIIPEETMEEIIRLSKEGLKEKHFYRPRYRANTDYELNELCVEDVTLPKTDFSFIAGHSSGDIFFMEKNQLIQYGKGYDESNPRHRTIFKHTHMDTEIMWNMHFNGCKLEYLENKYLHVDHKRTGNVYDQESNYKGYENKSNWGFIDYKKIQKEHNLIEITL